MSSASDIIYQRNEFLNKNESKNYDIDSNVNVGKMVLETQNFKRKRSIDETLNDGRNRNSDIRISSDSSSGSTSGNTSTELNSSFCESNLSCGISRTDRNSGILSSQEIIDSLAEPFSSLRTSLLSDEGNEFAIIRTQKSKPIQLVNNADSKLLANKRAYRDRLINIEQSPVKTYQNDNFMGDIELFNLSPLDNRFIKDNLMKKTIPFLSEFQEGLGALEWESLRRHQLSTPPTKPSINDKPEDVYFQQKVNLERENNTISNNQSYSSASSHVSSESHSNSQPQPPSNYNYDANRGNLINSSQSNLESTANYSSSPHYHNVSQGTATTKMKNDNINTSQMPPPRTVMQPSNTMQHQSSHFYPLSSLPSSATNISSSHPFQPYAHSPSPLSHHHQEQQQLQQQPLQYTQLAPSALSSNMIYNKSSPHRNMPEYSNNNNNNNNNNPNNSDNNRYTNESSNEPYRNCQTTNVNSSLQFPRDANSEVLQVTSVNTLRRNDSPLKSSPINTASNSQYHHQYHPNHSQQQQQQEYHGSSQHLQPQPMINTSLTPMSSFFTNAPSTSYSSPPLTATPNANSTSHYSTQMILPPQQSHNQQQQQTMTETSHSHSSHSYSTGSHPSSGLRDSTNNPYHPHISLSVPSTNSQCNPPQSQSHESSATSSFSHNINPNSNPTSSQPSYDYRYPPVNNCQQQHHHHHQSVSSKDYHHPPHYFQQPLPPPPSTTTSCNSSQHQYGSQPAAPSSYPPYPSAPPHPHPPYNYYQPNTHAPPPPSHNYQYSPYTHNQGREISPLPSATNYHPSAPPPTSHFSPDTRHQEPPFPSHHPSPYSYYNPQYPSNHPDSGNSNSNSSNSNMPRHLSANSSSSESASSSSRYLTHTYLPPPPMDYTRNSTMNNATPLSGPSSHPSPANYAPLPFQYSYPYSLPYGQIPPIPPLPTYHTNISFPDSKTTSKANQSTTGESSNDKSTTSPCTTTDKKRKKNSNSITNITGSNSTSNPHLKLSSSNSSDTRIGILPSVGQLKKESSCHPDNGSSTTSIKFDSKKDNNNDDENCNKRYRSTEIKNQTSSGESEEDEDEDEEGNGDKKKKFSVDDETKYATNEALFESLQNSIGVHCNCRKSRCLKLYCDCFRSKRYCDGCYCRDCQNKQGCDHTRDKSMRSILDKNPYAFVPRLQEKNEVIAVTRHVTGCNCKRSFCLKKYCECFQSEVMCSERCRCITCKNKDDGPFSENVNDSKSLLLKLEKSDPLDSDATAMITAMLLRQLATIKPKDEGNSNSRSDTFNSNSNSSSSNNSQETTTGTTTCNDPLLSFAGVCMQRATQERMDSDSKDNEQEERHSDLEAAKLSTALKEGATSSPKKKAKELLRAFFCKSNENITDPNCGQNTNNNNNTNINGNEIETLKDDIEKDDIENLKKLFLESTFNKKDPNTSDTFSDPACPTKPL